MGGTLAAVSTKWRRSREPTECLPASNYEWNWHVGAPSGCRQAVAEPTHVGAKGKTHFRLAEAYELAPSLGLSVCLLLNVGGPLPSAPNGRISGGLYRGNDHYE